MAVRKNYKALVKKLTKQVKLLERKEEKARRQLGAAIKKMRQLGLTYKTKLNNKLRSIKSKATAAKTSTYVKVAANLERKLLKGIQAKAKALTAAIANIEKKQVGQFAKGKKKQAIIPKKRGQVPVKKTTPLRSKSKKDK